MSIFLREPNPGDRISANLIRDIIRAIKELRPIAGHGMKLKRGPNGTTFNATVQASGAASAASRVGLPFDPVFEETETTGESGEKKKEALLKSVGAGLIPWGRRFYPSTPEVAEDAQVPSGLICLEITHPTDNLQAPTARIVKVAPAVGIAHIGSTEDTKSVLPLYQIKDGQIEIDYRCYLALAVRE